MKITTQRTMVWAVNFALVFALLGFVGLMVANTGKKRKKEIKRSLKALNEKVNAVSRPKRSTHEAGTVGDLGLKSVIDRKFYFEGYTKPPEVIVDNGDGKPAAEVPAPPLETLIQVSFVVAPSHSRPGPSAKFQESGVMVKILSIKKGATTGSVFWYREGDVIGAGVDERDDLDETLNDDRFKPCKILRIIPNGIICDWGTVKKREQVTIKIGQREPSKTISIAGGGISIGALKKGQEKEVDNTFISTPKNAPFGRRIRNKQGQLINRYEVTRSGMDRFGEDILKEVGSRKVEGGLELTSMSGRLSSFGLQPGDIITKVDDRSMNSQSSIVLHVKQRHKRQASFKVEYLREGETRTLHINTPSDLNNIKVPQGIKVGR